VSEGAEGEDDNAHTSIRYLKEAIMRGACMCAYVIEGGGGNSVGISTTDAVSGS
jgi:hypothetical protein